mmetsp:Transcript_49353/g.116299  ORF Transcript_49353/g.116299 Transcript_49353/m.116299 type:complete len:219 (+) Transcript_49353:1102-1758(+)
MSTNFLNSPGLSGIVDTSIASARSPDPEREATTRSLSKFMLAPLVIATIVLPSRLFSAQYFFAPATASAPDGSVIDLVSSKTSLIATHVSSVSTRITSSTRSLHSLKVSSPTIRTATPSANVSTLSRVTRSPAFSDRYSAFAPVGSTPMILMLGRRRLTYDATPAMSPPPPTGMKIAWMSLLYCRRISIPIVPWPAITRGWSKGGMNGMPSFLERSWA